MPTLVELNKSIDEKRKSLAEIFSQAKTDTGYDFTKVTLIEGDSASKAAQVQKRNNELTELVKEAEQVAELENAGKALEDAIAKGRGNGGGTSLPTGGNGGGNQKQNFAKSIGRIFVESDAFQKYGQTKGREVTVDLSAEQMPYLFPHMDSGAKALFDSTDYPSRSIRLPGILQIPDRDLVFDDLIPESGINGSSLEYVEESVATNGAAATAEGGTKQESALGFTTKTANVRKLATLLPVTDEMFADEPAMEGYVENRLRMFMRITRENQILSGNGTAPNLRGILNTSGIQTLARDGADPGPEMPRPDAIYRAMTAIQVNAFLEADASVWHPNDWQEIRLMRTDDGIYIWGNPSEPGPERIWGLRIVKSIALTEGTVLVGAFRASAQKFRRSELDFRVSDQHADFFIKNQLMLRVEERLALVIFRPAGFVVVTNM